MAARLAQAQHGVQRALEQRGQHVGPRGKGRRAAEERGPRGGVRAGMQGYAVACDGDELTACHFV